MILLDFDHELYIEHQVSVVVTSVTVIKDIFWRCVYLVTIEKGSGRIVQVFIRKLDEHSGYYGLAVLLGYMVNRRFNVVKHV